MDHTLESTWLDFRTADLFSLAYGVNIHRRPDFLYVFNF
jgi:hypothetical protein